MRYWKFRESNRVIRTMDITMNPDRWIEITKEAFEELRKESQGGK